MKEETDDFDEVLSTLNIIEGDEEENHDEELIGVVSHATVAAISKNRGGPRAAAIDRSQQKEMWSLGYSTWTDAQFKARGQVNRRHI